MAFDALQPQLAGRTGAQWNYQKIRTKVGKDVRFQNFHYFPMHSHYPVCFLKTTISETFTGICNFELFWVWVCFVFFLKEVKNKQTMGRSCTGWDIDFLRGEWVQAHQNKDKQPSYTMKLIRRQEQMWCVKYLLGSEKGLRDVDWRVTRKR